MKAFAMTILTWAAALAACHADQPGALGHSMPSAAEFSNRDNRLPRREGHLASCC